jgi:hypothetical protein
MSDDNKKKPHDVEVTVDGETVVVPERTTPNQILVRAGLDPTKTYLIEKKGNHTVSYKDNADVEIHVHKHQQFLTASRGPVTVSHSGGAELFAEQLKPLGIEPSVTSEWVEFTFEVPGGTYAGTTVRMAIQVPPEFPRTPPGGIHFKPRLRPVNAAAGSHPERSHESSRFPEGEYWSRPYQDWAGLKTKTASSYMGHVRNLWLTT